VKSLFPLAAREPSTKVVQLMGHVWFVKLSLVVFASPSNDIQDALLISKLADTVVIVAATTSGESRDREHLHLDDEADDLIRTLSLIERGKRIIVLMQVPGAVVMPWRDGVDGILAMFLGGQETGTAWGAVLFGDHSPTGRLPVTMPETDEDEVPPTLGGGDAVFAEALATGYRSKQIKAAFPFGHGLSYSTFSYGPLTVDPETCGDGPGEREVLLCLRTEVSNSGKSPARTVAQLYLEFPDEAKYPTAVLRGFAKTALLRPGSSQVIGFALTARDLSYYDASRGWLLTTHANVSVGESSADLRQSLPCTVAATPAPVPATTTLAPTSTSVTPTATSTTTAAATTAVTTTTTAGSTTASTSPANTSNGTALATANATGKENATTTTTASPTVATPSTTSTAAVTTNATNSMPAPAKGTALIFLSFPDVAGAARGLWNRMRDSWNENFTAARELEGGSQQLQEQHNVLGGLTGRVRGAAGSGVLMAAVLAMLSVSLFTSWVCRRRLLGWRPGSSEFVQLLPEGHSGGAGEAEATGGAGRRAPS